MRYLNFRNSSLSGNTYDGTEPRFSVLSPGLRAQVQISVYRPILESIRFFGWNQDDQLEMESVRKMFDSIDTDGGGELDKKETNTLFRKLGFELTAEQFDMAFSEMNRDGGGDVDFKAFQRWWFLKKYGKPQVRNRAPENFLNMLCTILQSQAFAKDELVCEKGDYGKSMTICLSGRLQILPNDGNSDSDFVQLAAREMFVRPEDREPMIGIAACLSTTQWRHVRNMTDGWSVKAVEYTDTIWFSRRDVMRAFRDTWPSAQDDVTEVAHYHCESRPPQDIDRLTHHVTFAVTVLIPLGRWQTRWTRSRLLILTTTTTWNTLPAQQRTASIASGAIPSIRNTRMTWGLPLVGANVADSVVCVCVCSDNMNARIEKLERNVGGKLQRIEDAVARLVHSA